MPINFSTNKDLLTELGYGSGGINDGWFQYLGSLGYTGSLDDRWRAFLRATYPDRSNASLADLAYEYFSDGGISLSELGEPITLASFTNDATDNPPIFSARRDLNSGMVWTEVTAAAANEPIVGRMVRADNGAAVSSWVDLGSTDGSGTWSGYITGAPRSFNALKAQVRYRDYSDTGETANTCFVGWVLSRWTQSNSRWLTDENFAGVSPTTTTALHDNRVRVITLARDPLETTPASTGDLITFVVASTPPTGRDPIWRLANVLMETFSDGPVIYMGHSREGTNDRQTVDDSQDKRFWEDELLIAQAGQPHLVDGTRPAVVDMVNYAFTSSALYTTSAASLGITGRIAFGVDPTGTAVTPGTLVDSFGGSFTYTQNHSWADIYNWTHSKLCFDERDGDSLSVTVAEATFEDHPVYGGFVAGFPQKFSPEWGTYGTETAGTWSDFNHFSRVDPGGQSHAAAVAGLVIARAAGRFSEGNTQLDWIQWTDNASDPLDAGADKSVVYVGIGTGASARDITTMREIFSTYDPVPTVGDGTTPGGDVLGFQINGAVTANVTIETVGGVRRIAIRKDDSSDFTGLDTIAWVPYEIATPPGGLESLTRFLDYPLVETGLTSMPGIHLDTYAADGLFASNPLPAPAVEVELLQHANHGGVTAGSPVNIATVTGHDGSPLAIFIAYDSTIANSGMYPNATTLGGVSIEPQQNEVFNGAVGVSTFLVESPGTGDLDLDVGFANSADEVNYAILRVNAGTFGSPVTISSFGSASSTAFATSLLSPSNNATGVHFILSQSVAADEALTGDGEWMGPEVTNGLMRTRVGKVDGVGSGVTSGFAGTFASATRYIHSRLFVIPET